jgi:flagellar hook-associated protein 2
MATISAAGVGSGLDIESIVSQLMTIERQPINSLETKKSSYETRLSAFGQVKSSLSSLQSAIQALAKSATFAATTATVADSSIFSAVTSSSATTGSYSIKINELAQKQKVVTDNVTEPGVADGDLTITLGTLSGGTFTADAGRSTTIAFTGSTLTELRDAINDADAGVSATIINNGTVNQLILTSDATGADQAFEISGTSGLSGFNFDPANASGSLSAKSTAQDASFEVDGIAITRSSNTVSDVIEGVTLTLKTKDAIGTTLTIEADHSVAETAINSFVSAYNSMNSTLRKLIAYNPDTGSAGSLNGESIVRSVMSQVRDIFTYPLSGLSGASSLQDIGFSFAVDGSLSVDSTKLTEALANADTDVATLFMGNDTVTGLATQLDDKLDQFLAIDGLLTSRTESINTTIKGYDDSMSRLETRMTAIEARYRAQFTALDTLMSSLNSTSSYLTQVLSSLPTVTSSSKK